VRFDLNFLLRGSHIILMWVVLAYLPFSFALAGGPMLQDDRMRVQAAADGTYVEGLAVNIGNVSSNATPEWVSLVTRSKGETLSHHFAIQGVDWNQDTLRWEVDEAGLDASVMSQDGRLEVRTRLDIVLGDRWINLGLEFINHSPSPLVLEQGLGLQLGPGLGEYAATGFGIADTLYSYVEPVISSREEELQRFPFDQDATDRTYDVNSASWAGLQSRYFALLLMPEGQQTLDRVRIFPGGESPDLPQRYLPKVVMGLEVGTLLPGGRVERNYKIFAGPKSKEALVGEGYDFSELLFPELWQWMRYLSFALLWMLEIIHSLVPSWGLAIILLAIFVRLIMYPLAQRSLKSQQVFMRVQKAMQADLMEIKKNYKGGEQSERILQLYEQHGVSPLAGLKPLLMVLIQLPIFVALFNVLGQVFELRDASFLWIDTLAEPDRLFALGFEIPLLGSYFNLLPVLMAASTLLMIGMSSTPAAETENKKKQIWPLLFMTLGFFVLFYPFPAGMVLYWTMANVLHLIQQWVVGHITKSKV
jgi:YidC/Oxa1 family membrane protein insertase